MRLGHPKAKRLAKWLEGGEEGLDAHLATCAVCAERLEQLAEADSELRQPLMELLAPPEELSLRLRGEIDDRLRSREDLSLISELFGLPIRAARVMSNTSTQGEF